MTEPREGQLIAGRYRLTRPLAAGGMGSVWVARHEGLGAPVAVKFLSRELSLDDEARARFAREASAAAMVRSRHVVTIVDFGQDERGRPYLAMELLTGHDLQSRIAERGRLSGAEAVAVVEQACKGLARAHASGVVHRDLKPANVFLTEDDDGLLVKLVDFGVAKLGGAAPDRLTRPGQLIGTPEYMSPEQVRAPCAIDHRSDLYAMGAVAYAALTGRPPFDREGLGPLLLAICTEPPPRPSSIDPSLGPAVDEFFERALAKDPSHRFASAMELARALAAAWQARPSPASAPARPTPDAARPIAGRFYPVKQLARSSTSAVHLVHQGNDELLVLKTLDGYRGADPSVVRAASVSLLTHLGEGGRYAVAVREVGVAEELGNTPFIVQERVRGVDLDSLSRGAPQPPGHALAWLSQASLALSCAHRVGLVHRDLRPDRLLIESPSGERSRVRVAGLGLADLTRALGARTERGTVRAIPLYAAPEQARGAAALGPSVDVWAMGLIAYRLLTGRDYWSGGDVMHVMGQLINEPIVPPSARGAPLGAAFDRWFLTSCDRDPTRRFSSVDEQLSALRSALGERGAGASR